MASDAGKKDAISSSCLTTNVGSASRNLPYKQNVVSFSTSGDRFAHSSKSLLLSTSMPGPGSYFKGNPASTD